VHLKKGCFVYIGNIFLGILGDNFIFPCYFSVGSGSAEATSALAECHVVLTSLFEILWTSVGAFKINTLL
jgi:hypothetical protein